jgi:ABC-type Fe2+-enterobactin transport system substrate-binding protein
MLLKMYSASIASTNVKTNNSVADIKVVVEIYTQDNKLKETVVAVGKQNTDSVNIYDPDYIINSPEFTDGCKKVRDIIVFESDDDLSNINIPDLISYCVGTYLDSYFVVNISCMEKYINDTIGLIFPE